MLWHVEGTALHILGSVHVSNRPLALSEDMTLAVSAAEVLAFEANFDATPDLATIKYERGGSLSKNIPAALFEDAQRLWNKLQLEVEELEPLRPWWAAIRLMNAAMSSRGFIAERGIDRQLLNLGKTAGKSLFFFESVGAGLLPFGKAPAHEQETFLSRVAQHTEEGLQELEFIVSAWESRIPANLLPVVERAMGLMPIAYSAALAGRNRAWLPHLSRLARSRRRTVAVVGALHTVGPDNIPSLLGAAGYTCTLV